MYGAGVVAIVGDTAVSLHVSNRFVDDRVRAALVMLAGRVIRRLGG